MKQVRKPVFTEESSSRIKSQFRGERSRRPCRGSKKKARRRSEIDN